MATTPSSSNTHIATHLLSLAHPPTTAARIFTEKVKLRPLHLKPGENPTPDARAYRRALRLQAASKLKKKRKPQPLTAAEKRATGLHAIPKQQQKYAIFEPLHRLWIGYMHEILGPGRPITGTVAAKLASADYHGALIEVSRSRCASRVGVKGIVVKDNKFTFEVITDANEMKVLPKEHTMFKFEVPEPLTEEKMDEGHEKEMRKSLGFEIHGDQFQHRAVDRANKKFKQHFLPDL
jgi:ribonuclease P protein subunit POP4